MNNGIFSRIYTISHTLALTNIYQESINKPLIISD
jgi:hypothetical protein